MTILLTDILRIQLPIIQAPMAGGATTPELVAAVSNTGGLGSFAAGYLSAEEIRQGILRIRALTNKPFAVNLFVPEKFIATENDIEYALQVITQCCPELNFHVTKASPPYLPVFDEQIKVILEQKVPVFSFTFGIPEKKWLLLLKENNVITMGTATTLAEANELKKNAIDIIIAQGSEAGGHRGTFLGPAEDALMNRDALLKMLVAQVTIPVIAAGGIMDASGIIRALKHGAAGVQMGTAFLCCAESGIHPCYKKRLLVLRQDDTVLTRAFSGKLARGVNNKFISRMEKNTNAILDYPVQNFMTMSMRKEAAKQNNPEFMSLWAGQAVSLIQELPAAKLLHELSLGIKDFI